MSNSITFINNYANTINQFITALNNLRQVNDQLADDPTLVTRYFATSSSLSNQIRTDIASTDIANASSAIGQILFTFSSGNPTQGSLLYKVTP